MKKPVKYFYKIVVDDPIKPEEVWRYGDERRRKLVHVEISTDKKHWEEWARHWKADRHDPDWGWYEEDRSETYRFVDGEEAEKSIRNAINEYEVDLRAYEEWEAAEPARIAAEEKHKREAIENHKRFKKNNKDGMIFE